jgi:hypothetical protein
MIPSPGPSSRSRASQCGSFATGYRPVTRARSGLMMGIRNPLDGPVFETEADALE